jgi:hypothetical protein
MTDTLALSVLAVVAGSVASDARPAGVLLEVAVGIALLALFCAFVLPWVTRFVFAGVGQHRGARFLWIAVALTAAALVADRAGIEGIVGAFFAGLALNRLVPSRSRLMEQIEFVGGVLLIPFFLLSTGMLIDPKAFTERRVIAIALISLAVVVLGKLVAAVVSSRVLGLSRPQGRLLFGLSLAQAAATLAAVTIGVDIGLFDTPLLNATLIVVLVTVLASSLITRSAARRIDPPRVQGERLAERVFVPVDVVDDPAVVELAGRMAMAKGGTVLVGAVAVTPGHQLDAARGRAEAAAKQVLGMGGEASSVVRVNPSEASAIAAMVAENGVTMMVTGWRRAAVAADVVLGGQRIDLVALADVPVLAVLAARGHFERVVLALDSDDVSQHLAERDLAIAVTIVAGAAVRGRVTVVVPESADRDVVDKLRGGGAEVVEDARPRRDAVAAIAAENDLVLVPARPGRSLLHRDAAAIAALPIGCSVAVPTRPHTGAGLVTGTTTLVGSRRTA